LLLRIIRVKLDELAGIIKKPPVEGRLVSAAWLSLEAGA